MNNNWEFCDLDKYINLIDYRGRTPKKTNEGVRLITAKNIKLGYLTEEPKEFIAEDNYESWMTRGIPNIGDVLFTTEAPLGNVAQLNTNEKVAFAQRTIALQPNTEKLDQSFLKYILLSPQTREDILSKATGATVSGIKSKLLKKIQIPIPSLTEQKQIVAILDKAFAAIDIAKANIEKNIQNAQQLFQSKLNEIFSQKGEGWEEKTWNDALEIRSGRNQKQVENTEGEYPILGSAGKTMGFADEYICEAGTTIIGRKGTINNPMYIESRFWNVDTAFGLDAKEDLHKKFLYFFCLSYDFTQRDKGSGRPSLVKRDLLTMTMPIPSLETQATTVIECENINQKLKDLEASYQNKTNSLEELKKSILQKAFAGELT